MLNRYSFEALDGGENSVSLKTTQEFDAPVSMDDLLTQCADLARLVARANPDWAPWDGWTVELGILLPRQVEWSLHRIRFEDLLDHSAARIT